MRTTRIGRGVVVLAVVASIAVFGAAGGKGGKKYSQKEVDALVEQALAAATVPTYDTQSVGTVEGTNAYIAIVTRDTARRRPTSPGA